MTDEQIDAIAAEHECPGGFQYASFARAVLAANSPDARLPQECAAVTVDIPVAAARRIADEFGYDQVVIVARKVGVREHVTTYGVDKANCDVAARIGNFFKHKLMGWPET